MVHAAAPVARRYHDLTSHTPDSVRSGGHTLDWDNKPFPFKVYTDIPGLHLPREVDVLATPTLAAIAGYGPPPRPRLTLSALVSLLYYTAGVTKQKTYPGGGQVLFRAAASTGALYQTEVYVIVGALEDLSPGVYHFCPGDFTLRRLRDDDARGALASAVARRRWRRAAQPSRSRLRKLGRAARAARRFSDAARHVTSRACRSASTISVPRCGPRHGPFLPTCPPHSRTSI